VKANVLGAFLLLLIALTSVSPSAESQVPGTHSGTIDAPDTAPVIIHHHNQPAPSPAQACSLPPKRSFNPYDYQIVFDTDSHTYNPYTSGLNPYSGDPEPNANIFHEPKKAGDEPGHWARTEYPVSAFGNLNLTFDAHLDAHVTNGRGGRDLFGDWIEMTNRNKAPIYFGLTTSVLNDKIMPGQTRTIKLGIMQPTSAKKSAVEVNLNVKYWVSDGVAPPDAVRCDSWNSYFSYLESLPYDQYRAVRNQRKWRWIQTTQYQAGGGETNLSFRGWFVGSNFIVPSVSFSYDCTSKGAVESVTNNSDDEIFVEAVFTPGTPDRFAVPPKRNKTMKFQPHACGNYRIDVSVASAHDTPKQETPQQNMPQRDWIEIPVAPN
jgi:hypothetical protein